VEGTKMAEKSKKSDKNSPSLNGVSIVMMLRK
jgi:hypothetical protein